MADNISSSESNPYIHLFNISSINSSLFNRNLSKSEFNEFWEYYCGNINSGLNYSQFFNLLIDLKKHLIQQIPLIIESYANKYSIDIIEYESGHTISNLMNSIEFCYADSLAEKIFVELDIDNNKLISPIEFEKFHELMQKYLLNQLLICMKAELAKPRLNKLNNGII